MDVDSLQKAETMEDKKKHRDEGHCFECSKQGHMAQNCDKEEAEEYKEEEEEPQEQDEMDNLVNRMIGFSDKKKV